MPAIFYYQTKKKLAWRRPTLPEGRPSSTIGAGGLDYRVRHETGYFPAARFTSELLAKRPACRVLRAELTTQDSALRTLHVRCCDSANERGNGDSSIESYWIDSRAIPRTSACALGVVGSTLTRLTRPPYRGCGLQPRLVAKSNGRSDLAAGFPLRCIQRLSLPDLATQRCGWHHNWHTSGRSIPVLSY